MLCVSGNLRNPSVLRLVQFLTAVLLLSVEAVTCVACFSKAFQLFRTFRP